MRAYSLTLVSSLALSLCAGAALADGHAAEAAFKERNANMKVIAQNAGKLGDMVKGTADYDSNAASASAAAILEAAMMDLEASWPEGSDSGAVPTSRAKADIWANWDDFAAKNTALVDAAKALDAAAGEGQQAMAAAFQGVADTCSSCHRAYRGPKP